MTPNANCRRDPIPKWINALSLLIVAILAFQSFSAYFAPSLAFGDFSLERIANQQAMSTLAGRNVVMLVLTLMALKSQNAVFLAYTFLMHLLRELQDMFIVPHYLGFTTPRGMAIFGVFLLVFVIPELMALLKLKKLAATARPVGAEFQSAGWW